MLLSKIGKRYKKESIPKPNPRKVELPKSLTFNDIVDLANVAHPSRMELADSSSLSINVNKSEWKLDSYYKHNSYKHSHHKLTLCMIMRG